MWLKVCECLFHHWCAVKTLCMMTCFWFDLFSAPKLIIVARGIFKPIFTLTAMWGKLSNACAGVYCEHRGLWVTDSWVIPQSAHAGCYNKHTSLRLSGGIRDWLVSLWESRCVGTCPVCLLVLSCNTSWFLWYSVDVVIYNLYSALTWITFWTLDWKIMLQKQKLTSGTEKTAKIK